ncbi:uncharacterized protein K444DRAFT_136694 [Hyaloscypha bicolor E]|uniref:Uncharacterized protein n=1 Tax=Hyaloscypha bicolor E TaxID=1095630 RepID=A0A2J6STQ2_9HELO|nr:uncharacterized protein K444DRAFT_136694 [Hyaloscypha bicolor E]PMD54168.1 hypothetical protein K444DRAFT_136694 [Hyaloscypha bicolor E]
MCCRIAAERRGGAGKGLAATRFQPDSGTAVPCTCCPASRRAALLHPPSASFVVPSLYSAAYPFYRSHIDCIYCIEWSFLHFQEVVRWYQHPSLSQALRAKIQRSLSNRISSVRSVCWRWSQDVNTAEPQTAGAAPHQLFTAVA